MKAADESPKPVTQVAEIISRLRCDEDYNLALKMQNEEFTRHYEMNRGQRRQIRSDHNHSKNEQKLENQLADQMRRQLNLQISKEDEAMARRLQEEFEVEERILKQMQSNFDEQLAKSMQKDDEQQIFLQRAEQTKKDEYLARCLQMGEGYFEGNENCRNHSDCCEHVQYRNIAPIDKNNNASCSIKNKQVINELQKKINEERRTQQAHMNSDTKSSFTSLFPAMAQHRSSNSVPQHSFRRWQDSVDVNTENEIVSGLQCYKKVSGFEETFVIFQE
ncbi:unnamed protein product [Thelazia callipaeda]|uniref:CCDC50_N domain-containing protein n=1 Tax=Thelazia callipaeda TaxID=103827 RepID=A0A0N5CJC0_THECL|nr:unnamed protein product [Thelazia callipaeda]